MASQRQCESIMEELVENHVINNSLAITDVEVQSRQYLSEELNRGTRSEQEFAGLYHNKRTAQG